MQKKAAARAPGSFEQYLADIRDRTTALERFTDRATSLDDRIDVSNLLLIEILKALAKEIEINFPEYPKEGAAETTGYAIKSCPMDIARASPGEEIRVQGDTVVAHTDDDLAGCFIRINSPVGDPIPLEAFNPYIHQGSFSSIWLETPARPGMTITLMICRAGSQAIAHTVRTVITAQLANITVTATNLSIAIDAQNVGIILQPEWAAITGDDLSLHALAFDRARGSGTEVWYEVPAGRTFYVTQFCGSCYAFNAADSELNQMCYGFVQNAVATNYSTIGGNGGFVVTYTKPLVITAGTIIYFGIRNRSNHNCTCSVMGSGYLI